MSAKQNHIGKDEILQLLQQTQEIIPFYERSGFNFRAYYPAVDQLALRLFEQREGVIVNGVTLRGDNINVHCVVGSLSTYDTELWVGTETRTYVLENFRATTVARFAESICDVLTRRANNGLSGVMMDPNVGSYVTRTRKEVRPYAR